MIKVQITLVACPGFGPIFRLLAGDGYVFGIGGFEPRNQKILSTLHAMLQYAIGQDIIAVNAAKLWK